MDPEDMDLAFWSSYLNNSLAENLISKYQSASQYYAKLQPRPSSQLLWFVAMQQVMDSSQTTEEAAIKAHAVHLPEGASCEDIKDIVAHHLQHSVVRLTEYDTPLNGKVLVAKSETLSLDRDRFAAWELKFMATHTEIDCSSSALLTLKKYAPRHSWKRTPFTLSWKVNVTEHEVVLEGRIYLLFTADVGYPSRKVSQHLHRLLTELKQTNLPEIPQTIDTEATVQMEPLQAPGAFLTLPITCPYEYFYGKNYSENVVTQFPPLHQKLKAYMSFSPKSDIESFINTHERVFTHEWLCHSLSHSPKTVICPYSTRIRTVNEALAVKGGILFGDAMVGKTHFMLQHILQTADNFTGKTLYIVQPYDKKVVKHATKVFAEEKQTVGIYWDWKDFSKIDDQTFAQHKVIIVNAKFISRSANLKAAIQKSRCSRLVVDHFEMVEPRSRLYDYIQHIATDIIWLITAKMSIELLSTAYRFLRLNQCLLGSELVKDYSLLACALFRALTYHVIYGKNHMTVHTRFTSTQYRIELPRRRDQYPYRQIIVALRESLDQATPKQMSSLLALLSSLDSGIPMKKREVDELLLIHSFNVRVGGGIFIVMPQLHNMPPQEIKGPQPSDVCGICREEISDPVRNEACRHMFCYQCMEEWNRIKSSCPQCRADYDEVFYRIDFKEESARKRRRLTADFVSAAEPGLVNEDLLPAEELYMDQMRTTSLQTVLKQKLYNKVLIITHWRRMLHHYAEAVREAVPEDTKVSVISKKISYTEYNWSDKVIAKSRVVIIHADNVNIFRSNGNFKQVIVMDSNGGVESVENWYNYFRHCLSRVYHLTSNSLDKMFMNELDQIVSRSRLSVTNNVRFPKMTARDVLERYYHYLRNG